MSERMVSVYAVLGLVFGLVTIVWGVLKSASANALLIGVGVVSAAVSAGSLLLSVRRSSTGGEQ